MEFGVSLASSGITRSENMDCNESESENMMKWKQCVNGCTQNKISSSPPTLGINKDLIPPDSSPLTCFRALLTEDLIHSLIEMINERGGNKLHGSKAGSKGNGNNDKLTSVTYKYKGNPYSDGADISDSECESDVEFLENGTRRAGSGYWVYDPEEVEDKDFYSSWTDVTLGEMYKFLLVLVNLGWMTMPNLRLYWGSGFPYDGKFYRNIFSQQRFFQIYNIVIELCDFSKPTPMVDFVELLVKNFSAAFHPGEYINIEELVTGSAGKGWSHGNGRVSSCHRVKTLGLVDNNSGYVINLCNYYGPSHKGYKPKRMESDEMIKTLDKLLSPCSAGHHISLDQLYSHLPVLKHLGKKFYYTGSLDMERDSNIQSQIRKDFGKLKDGETKWLIDENEENLIAMYRVRETKFSAALISNHARTQTKGLEDVEVPAVFHDYNMMLERRSTVHKIMEGYGNFHKPYKCWNHRFFRWLIEIVQMNTLTLYTLSQTKLPKIRHQYEFLKKFLSVELCCAAAKYYSGEQGTGQSKENIDKQSCLCRSCFSFWDDDGDTEEARSWKSFMKMKTVFNLQVDEEDESEEDCCDNNEVEGEMK